MLLQNRTLSLKILFGSEYIFLNKVSFKLYFVGKRRCNKKCHCDTDQCCHVNGSGDIKLTGSDTMVLRRDVCIFIHKMPIWLGVGRRQSVVKWMQDVTYSFEYTSTDLYKKGECVFVLFEVISTTLVSHRLALWARSENLRSDSLQEQFGKRTKIGGLGVLISIPWLFLLIPNLDLDLYIRLSLKKLV